MPRYDAEGPDIDLSIQVPTISSPAKCGNI
jgi:hypothetical protein